MSRTPAEHSLQFYVALDAIEQCFNFVDERYSVFSNEIEWLRNEMERVADEVLEIAAFEDWTAAQRKSGFKRFYAQFEDFSKRARVAMGGVDY